MSPTSGCWRRWGPWRGKSSCPRAAGALAYADVPVAIAPGRYLLDPRSFAKLLQLAEIGPEDRVLDVGCGTGYSAAVLARLAGEVVALEQDADLVRAASQLLANAVGKVEVVQGGLIEGVKDQAPYDVIFINGAVEQVPETPAGPVGGRRPAGHLHQGRPEPRLAVSEGKWPGGQTPGFRRRCAAVLAGFRRPSALFSKPSLTSRWLCLNFIFAVAPHCPRLKYPAGAGPSGAVDVQSPA